MGFVLKSILSLSIFLSVYNRSDAAVLPSAAEKKHVSDFDSTLLTNQFYQKYHAVLNAPSEFYNDFKLFLFLEKWIGTRYVYGGTTLSGVDCSAFTSHFAKDLLGAKLVRTARGQHEQFKENILMHELKTGDLVFFHTTRPGISHVGVYLTNNKFIHASSSRGVVIDDLTATYYTKAYRAARRINLNEADSLPIELNSADLRVINLTGKYNSGVLINTIQMNPSLFHQLNPDFDKTVWTSTMLRLPKAQMESFLLQKEKILENSVNAIMQF